MPSNRLEELQKSIGLTFEDQKLLRLTMVHRSYLNERSNAHESNERLEFLGDAVLSLIVASYLYRNYPKRPEGELTDLRSALVRRETLAKWAQQFRLGEFLYLGKGEARSGGRNRSLILASAFEAVLGALFVERGIQGATAWLVPIIEPELAAILAEGRHYDYKGLIQKAVQRRFGQAPVYEVVEESGPEHEPSFEIEVRVNDLTLGRGAGLTKQVAQQVAAKAGLAYLETLPVPVAEPIGKGELPDESA